MECKVGKPCIIPTISLRDPHRQLLEVTVTKVHLDIVDLSSPLFSQIPFKVSFQVVPTTLYHAHLQSCQQIVTQPTNPTILSPSSL